MISMVKGLLVVAAVGVVALVAVAATGGVDDLRAQLPDIRNPFREANKALRASADRERQWDALVKQANSICSSDPEVRFVVRPTLPANRRRYARAIGRELDREVAIQAQLVALQPPANYEGPYSLFIHNRGDVLAALDRLQSAARAKNREDYTDAVRVIQQKTVFVDHYAATVGMPACAFGFVG